MCQYAILYATQCAMRKTQCATCDVYSLPKKNEIIMKFILKVMYKFNVFKSS